VKIEIGITIDDRHNANLRKTDGCWVGWIDDVPGINCQESSRDELLNSLREALVEARELDD